MCVLFLRDVLDVCEACELLEVCGLFEVSDVFMSFVCVVYVCVMPVRTVCCLLGLMKCLMC